MATGIKITSLSPIGANITYTTLVPVVNMAGPPTTEKATTQVIGNLILNGAGGSYFPPAAQAVLAQSVTNAAQPNITSVGTLTSLAVSGNVNLGAVGNVIITGGSAGQKLTTDGNGTLSWTNDANSSYGNSNVAAYLPTYTGNVGAGNINVTGLTSLGAVGNVIITGGSNGQVLTTNGSGNLSWTTVSGNGTGSELVNGNNSFVLDNDGNVVFEGTPAGNAVNRGLVWDFGANANGVNSQLRQDNSGFTVRAWTENSGNYSAPVNIVTNQDANTKTWIFDGNGNLTLPGNLIVPEGNIESATISPAFSSAITGITTGNATVIVTLADPVFGDPVQGEVTISSVTGTTEANGVWGYQATEPNEFQLYTDATITTPVDGTTWTAYVSGGNAVGVSTYTDFTIQGGNVSIGSNDNTWVFDIDGIISAGGNLKLAPDSTNAASYLDVFLSSGPDLHLVASNGANLILGEDDGPNVMASWDGNVYVQSWSTNTNTQGGVWTFGEDGLLTLPSGNVVIGNLFGGEVILASNTPFGVVSQGNGSTVLQWMDDVSNASALSAIYINSPSGNTGDVVVLTGAVGPNANIWNFTANGVLSLAKGNSTIESVANSAGDLSGLSTLQLMPDSSTTDDRYLIVDPTGPNHIHIRAGGNIDNSNVVLILGGETSSFEVGAGLNPDVYVRANNLNWTFTTNPVTTEAAILMPGDTTIETIGGHTTLFSIGGGGGPEMAYANANSYANISDANVMYNSVYVNQTGLFIDLDLNSVVDYKGWAFTNTGDFVFPDNTVQTTAYTGGSPFDQNLNTNNSVQFANVTSTGNVSANGNVGAVNFSASGNVSANGNVSTGNVTTTGKVFTSRVEHPNVGDIIVKPWSNFNQGSGANNYNYMFGAPDNFGSSVFQIPYNTVIKPNGVDSNEYVALQSNKYAELKVDSQFPATTSLVSVESSRVRVVVDTANTGGPTATWSFQTSGISFPDSTVQKTAFNGTDKFFTKTGATGVVTHDCANGSVFYHTSISSNFTADVTNLPTAISSAGSVTLVLVQGATPYVCNAIQINGAAQTVLWQGSASAPTGNANKTDIMTFRIMRTGASTYVVFGQLESFG